MQVGISLTGNRRAGGASFSPNALFAASEAGDWFDPSDLSRMWQDTAGTTPVTADGQTVGLMLGQRRGAEVEIAPNWDFSSGTTGWSGDATISSSSGNLIITATSSFQTFILDTAIPTVAGRTYRMIVSVLSNDTNTGNIRVGTFSSGLSLYNGNSTLINGAKDYTFYFTATSTTSYLWMQTGNAASGTVTVDFISVKEVALTDLTQSDAAKRPAYKTSGGLHWLQFDGTNDALASAATLNLSGTDKVTVCAGVRALSDAAIGMIAEVSANINSNNGVFALWKGGVAAGGASYRTISKGTVLSAPTIPTSYAVPITNVLTMLADISGDSVVSRIDGGQVATSGTDQGTGNFGNHTLFVGARDQTSLYLNGDIYFLLIRGALTAGADLTALEGFAAARTGITL